MSETATRRGPSLVTVTADDAGQRLDRWFKRHYPALTHGQLEKLLRKGQVRVDGGRAKASRRLEAGEAVRVPPMGGGPAPASQRPAAPVSAADAAMLEELILYEDDAVLALNKPFGLAVQGGAKTARHLDGLLTGVQRPGLEKPRLTHRLDRDTGGVLVLAKTRRAATALTEAFRTRQVQKTYWALTAATPRPARGTIDAPIGPVGVGAGDGQKERMGVAPSEEDGEAAARAKPAVTDYQLVDQAAERAAWLALRPRTGRTHQLRVHCAAIGAPIVGDGKYGGPRARVAGLPAKLHLFAREAAFAHPETGRPLVITAPLGGHMLESWRFFGFDPQAPIEPFPDELLAPPRAGGGGAPWRS
ncbi:MAG: RluA family pseudouridine synthase [Pseudomonadota bacterium]